MRVVLDTNVFISAGLKTASWPAIAVRWLDRSGGLLKTNATETELFAVLARPRFSTRLPSEFVAELRRILGAAEAVAIAEKVVACRDPRDDKFLELAVNGRADVLVSGDADLLDLHPFRVSRWSIRRHSPA